MHRPALLLALPLLLSSCFIYPDDKPCAADYGNDAPEYIQEQRDPQTGTCQSFGGGGGGGGACGDEWGGAQAERAPEPNFDWALCYQQCEGLDEATCLGTSACRAAYIDQSGSQTFYECWGTAPSGPIQGGNCEGLDAQECSRHDDCSAVHSSWEAPGPDGGFTNGIADFQSCIDESGMQGCYSDNDCGNGTHCNADTECLPAPGCGQDSDGDGLSDPCEPVCYGFCVPDPTPNPGTCTSDNVCDIPPPNCPVDTLPGILNDCWTGYCIPTSACESVAECPSLGESSCVSRSDCRAIYQGVDCSCNGESCTCTDWDFESCEASLDTTPAWP